jgi:putative SOS response-associated peptidase YedK
MCGRFAFYSPREAVAEAFGVRFPAPFEPRFNIAPSQFVAVIRSGADGEPVPAMLRWGLIPAWSKDPAIGNRLINARAETVADKPAFRAAFRRRRCVLLADGFFEWQGRPGRKQPYYITPAAGGPFAMGGLWERWDRGDQPVESCTIITVPANARLARIHSRMPSVIAPGGLRAWLDPAADEASVLAMLGAAAESAFRFHPVSLRVNNAGNQGAELIAPVEVSPGGT